MEQEESDAIRECLIRMGRAAGSLRVCERLQGGVSGSRTYRLALETEDAILKVTAADADPAVVERARREAEFYQQLAGAVPVRVPRLLGVDRSPEGGIDLLLAAYRPCPPPEAWTEPDYLRVCQDLARLHARFWNPEPELSRFSWLRVRRPGDTAAEVRQAHDYWQALREQEHLQAVLSRDRGRTIQGLLRQIETIEAILRRLPPTLCHGDCHIGNLLHGADGALVWADWQEVGVGRGPEDLSLLLQRASSQGGRFREATLLEAYRENLAAALNEELSAATIREVLHASELRTRLLYWPAYLKRAPATTLDRMVERICELADWLGIRIG